MRAGRLTALVAGSVLLLPAIGAIVGGGALALGYAFGRTTAGEFELSVPGLDSSAAAITAAGPVVLTDVGTPSWFADTFATDIRVVIRPQDAGTPIFVGVGSPDQVDAYLGDVARDDIIRLDAGSPVLERLSGATAATPPTAERFWSVSASGSGPQQVRYSAVGAGRELVVMNADGSAGIAASAVLAVTAPFLLPLSLVVIGVGILVALSAGLLLRVGTRRTPSPPVGTVQGRAAAGAPARTVSREHPVRLEARLDERLSRWLWLVKWLLAVPHLVVLALLWPAFVVVTVVAGVSILFTGVYPRSLFDFTTGVLRWTCRVSYYAFHGGMGTDVYPPFSLGRELGYPITLDIHYPQRLSSGLVLVKWWLLALPQYVVVGLLVGNWFGWTGTDGLLPTFGPVGAAGVLGILVVAAGVVLLVTGRYPRSLYDLVIGLNRWIFRVAAYACLMTDVYPPFRLDQGGSEPPSLPPITPSGDPRQPAPVAQSA